MALVAQMVERKTLNLVVVGSSPTEGVFAHYRIKVSLAPHKCTYTTKVVPWCNG